MDNNTSQVLIVDDLPINRMILSSLLASHGVLSDQAESGFKCLELCKENDYDLILLDHRMPDMDGVDTLTELKKIFKDRGRSIPVICHTTEDGRKNINLYIAAGFRDVLIKPIDPKQLSDVLMTYLPIVEESDPSDEQEPAAAPEQTPKFVIDDETIKDELDKLPMWLKTVPHIDLSAGIKGCGSAEDYVDALYIFRSSIDEKATDITEYLAYRDWTMYRISVHSLKSMARLVGAKALSEFAAKLEDAADKDEHDILFRDTSELIREYRKFDKYLEPLMDDEDIKQIMEEGSDQTGEIHNEIRPIYQNRTVLFIQSNQDIVTKGIEKNLSENDFKVIQIPDRPDVIINHKFDANIILYYPGITEEPHIDLTMNLLGEICQDDSKILCLIGAANDIDEAMASKGSYRVSRTYIRPVEMTGFIEDMIYLADLLDDYHRKKNIYVVDDDKDYLSVIERWLSSSFNASCFNCADDMLSGISTMVPDLILLDYEMPDVNGFELMQTLRTDPETANIPIIFLTGKNDRDHVYSILHYKPDGYLLKSSTKDALLDSIQRFFTETFYKKSLYNAGDRV